MLGQRAQTVGARASDKDSDDFHDFLARNLSTAYRLAVMVLDDPIAAADAVHDAALSAWASDAPTPSARDEIFRTRLDTAVAEAAEHARAGALELSPLEGALLALDAGRRVEMARACGLSETSGAVVGVADVGAAGADMGARTGEADVAGAVAAGLRELAARVGAAEPEAAAEMLRALYAGRDPGEPAPLPLRMRLAQDSGDVEIRSAASARPATANGWGFVFNTFLALLVLTLVVALTSVINVRSNTIAGADPTSDPSSPLTITGVSALRAGVDGDGVHVGSTQRTLIVSFSPAAIWHASTRSCLADVVGVVDWQGQTSWIGSRAGHVESITGDPSSPNAYVDGLGDYCEPGRFTSTDGGGTWTQGTLPGDGSTEPAWLTFDPAQPGKMLAFAAGTLYTSADSGANWSARASAVTPLAFDSTGRLVGWEPGRLLESTDEGTSWQQTGAGPADRPTAAGATSQGILIGAGSGLWWYPVNAAANLIKSGSVYSIATLGDEAVVLGSDPGGRPWLGTVSSTVPGIAMAALPQDVADLRITGGEVAVNDSGAAIAFAGPTSVVALATFAR